MTGTGLRWFLKKAARRGFAATSGVTGQRCESNTGARVLTYHRFGDGPRDPFCVRPEDFEQQMALLARASLLLSLNDLEEGLAGRRTLADGAVLVTIDDGCPSVRTLALPILREYAVPAVVFVPAGEIRADGSDEVILREHPDDRMTWRALEDLARAGIAIASHAWTHVSLARLSMNEAREAAARSRETLQQRLGQPVTAFAYPFGTRADYSDMTAKVVQETGYTCAFTSQHGAIRLGMNPYTLPRVKVEGGEGLWMFRALIRGGLDGWAWVDRTLWKLQAAGT